MTSSSSGISPKAIGWALLSQVFWVPLVAVDLHDRWVAPQRDITPPGRPLPQSPIARATPFSLNDLIAAARPVQQLVGQANQAVSGALGQSVRGAASGVGVLLSAASSSTSSLLDRPLTVSLESDSGRHAAESVQVRAGDPNNVGLHPANTMLGRAFTRAQLLGGSLSLADLNEGPLAPLALAERSLQRSSGDPLAPLPSLWREPMRQALLKLPGAGAQLSTARSVIVPSSAVTRPVEVPLALQSDGSVDVLEPPSDPAVLREIDGWSRQQRLPASGSVQPALLQLHPLPAAEPSTPPASTGATARAASSGSASARSVATARPALEPSPSVVQAPVSPRASQAEPAPPPPAPAPAASEATIPVPIASETPSAAIPIPILSEAPTPAP